MKILIIGKGGREHALAWKLSQNQRVEQIYIAEGNSGCELLAKVINVPLSKIDELHDFAQQKQVDLTIVGSEELLVQGIVDKFKASGLKIFGPDKHAAQLEGSKVFAKDFMNKYGIKTAKHQSFNDYAASLKYLDQVNYPIVIKASGLAAGKGVVIAESRNDAEIALAEMLLEQVFGASGCEVVIEEFLVGVEASILSFTDCNVILPLISAKDHKKIGEGETGLNTGGMGVIAPNPYVTDVVHQQFMQEILAPTLAGIQAEKMDFAGVIFFGVMITNHGIYLLEYNMRLGDPETQAVLPLLESDLLNVFEASIEKRLSQIQLNWHTGATCCVVLASGGYPEKYQNNLPISGIEEFGQEDCQLFTAGVKLQAGQFVTAGGRVLNIVGKGSTSLEAREKAYAAAKNIQFKNCYLRQDIGKLND